MYRPALRSVRAQTEVVGVALVLAIVVLGTTAVVALGATAFDETRSSSELQSAEHAMTLFDSRVAMVALGESDTQTVQFGQGAGQYAVDETSGRITVTHVNFNGGPNDDGNAVDDGSGDDDEELYSERLGAVTYTNGGTTIAYQGGGVWRVGENGGEARMISPPEFHYRGATLTLPVVQVDGETAGSGAVSASVTSSASDTLTRAYPNESFSYGGSSDQYLNPVGKGFVRIEVSSPYYEAWGNYFEQRTDGAVTRFDGNQTARLDLIALGAQGDFSFVSDSDSLEVRGIDDGHAVDDFSLDLRPSGSQNSKFNNVQWSLHAEDGQREFEVAFRRPTGGGTVRCGGNEQVRMNVYYSEDGGTTYEGWSTIVDVTCNGGDISLQVDLTADDVDGDGFDEDLTYTGLGSGSYALNYHSPGTLKDPGDFVSDGAHSSDSFDPAVPDTRTSPYVVRHYLSRFGSTFDLQVEQGSNAGMCYQGDPTCDASGGFLSYDGNDQVVTFLHISQNGVEVEFD